MCSQPDAWESTIEIQQGYYTHKIWVSDLLRLIPLLFLSLLPLFSQNSEAVWIPPRLSISFLPTQLLCAMNSTSTVNLLFHSGPHQPSPGLSKSFLESLSAFCFSNVIWSPFEAWFLVSHSFIQFFLMTQQSLGLSSKSRWIVPIQFANWSPADIL